MTSSRWRWFVVLAMLSACGGRVELDTSGDGGGAGGGGGAALSACEEWCDARTADCPYVGSCMDHCLESASHLAPCEPEFAALRLCAADHLSPDCGVPVDGCEAELDALLACVYPTGPCGQRECVTGFGAGTPALQCDVTCGGVVYTSACGETGKTKGFPMDCLCQIDGEPVGTCQNVTGDGSAGLDCCSAYFAESQ